MSIDRLLIANRGEIACRIIRSAHELGILCAAVYSEADRHARHVQLADEAFCIGGAESRHSYLNSEHILQVARRWQADAIHPGYGFLSENAEFAQNVTQAGIIFVGPHHTAIASMGVKSHAKRLMQEAGVPVLSGYHAPEQSAEALQSAADALGYPLLIKAVAGGGGRGLRVVEQAADFPAALAAVQREAASSFGDARVLLERYLQGARHIEVQIFGDSHGNCVHLFERDCSIQRRHQKVVEEAPAPGLSTTLQNALGDTAVRAAKAIDYVGAGTVEFLLHGEAFHFMEMNTRLQVEHPVTEAITGLDLVAWQLKVAAGERLPLTQQQIRRQGCAIEVRINAEDALHNFLPGSGLIRHIDWPAGNGIRVDSGISSGDRIGTHYDALLAKLIVHGEDRDHCLARLRAALAQLRLEGVSHNVPLLQAIVLHPAFVDAAVDTGFLDAHWAALRRQMLALVAAPDRPVMNSPDSCTNWQSLKGWRNLSHNPFSRRYHLLGFPSPTAAAAGASPDLHQQDALLAPLPGQVLALHVAAGERVEAGQALVTLEAMKMEHTLNATASAVVLSVHCAVNERVNHEQLLLRFAEQAQEQAEP